MRLAIFGATGALGSECLALALDAGHEVRVLVRDPSKLRDDDRHRIEVIDGDALDAEAVARCVEGSEAVLFAIGVDAHSPEDLCTDSTRHILDAMRSCGTRRLVWCGGGSTLVEDDTITFGAKFVEAFTRVFMGLRHRDKEHQLALLEASRDVEWLGVRPLQMRAGPARGRDGYRLGFHRFSGFSKIHFADCADAMLGMLEDDTWLHKAPIVQY